MLSLGKLQINLRFRSDCTIFVPMKVSIVIPVYNVEATLRTCVESAKVEAFDDWEMILVDDGSKDGSPALCDKLAQEDRHIRVLHKPNGGLSDARNAGIDAARGEYLSFVDSDDTLQRGTLEHMVRIMDEHPEYDILEFPVSIGHGGPRQRELSLSAHEYRQAADYWIDGEAFRHAYACNKVYRRQLFDAVRYPRGRVFEDVHVLPQLLRRARTVATTTEGLYYYRYNPDSITNTADGEALNDLLEAHIQVLTKEKWLWEGKDVEAYYAHVLNIQLDVCDQTGRRPVLPHMPYRGTAKLRLLQWLGMERLCLCHKIMHRMTKLFG